MDSIFSLMNVPLRCPNYSSISKRANTVDIPIKMPTLGEIRHLAINATGLKVLGEGEWKTASGYHSRSISETAMFRYKTLMGENLRLRDYDAQVGKAYGAVRALNKLTGLGMPKTYRIDQLSTNPALLCSKIELINKATELHTKITKCNTSP